MLQMRPVVNRKNAASRLGIATSVVLLGLGFGLAAFAQESDADEKDHVAPDHAQLKQWVEDLDSGQFSKRQHATVELRRAGTRVFPLLVEASASESRERSGRAIQILEYYFKNGDADSKAAAEKALKKCGRKWSATSVSTSRAYPQAASRTEESRSKAATRRDSVAGAGWDGARRQTNQSFQCQRCEDDYV